ncbi:hypothetical protein TrCOL_g8648 [Triparma columacea]|uniref:CCHC-type domain-containing protein n=1 Tax=Triparma columacea TaxID=722753 RepID=A0A9W7FYY4_9STRA|nr:hypothetical protein TrCOL_g8648 [Triparma columacea]
MPPKSLKLSSPVKKATTTNNTKKNVKLVPPKQPRSPVKRKREKKDFFTPSPSKKLKEEKTSSTNTSSTNTSTSTSTTSAKSVTPSPKKDQVRPTHSRSARKLDAGFYKEPNSVIDVDDVDSPVASQSSLEDVSPPTYIPLSIYKNISYTPRSPTTHLLLSPPRRVALAKVLEKCSIPADFETRKYGPLSGTNWEERVLTCYDNGMIGGEKKELICTECGEIGHKKKHCVKLI